MKWAVAVICIGAGLFTGELITRVPAAHETTGRIFGRGHLIAPFAACICPVASWISCCPTDRSSSAPRVLFDEPLPEITAAIAARKRTEAIREPRGQLARRFRACSRSNVRSWNCTIASLNAG